MLFDKVKKPGYISLLNQGESQILCKIFIPDFRYFVYSYPKFVNQITIDQVISKPTITIDRQFFSLFSKLSITFVDNSGQIIKTKPIDASWIIHSDLDKIQEIGFNVAIS
jgi:hypothetical protein